MRCAKGKGQKCANGVEGGKPSNSGRKMDDPSVWTIVAPREAGEEDTAAEKVEPSHAVTARVPLGTGLEMLCGSSHHRWRKCLALLSRSELAKPDSEGTDDTRDSHRTRRMAIGHNPRRSTTDLDLCTKIGDQQGDEWDRRLERRLLKCRSVEIGVTRTHNKFSRWARNVEVNAWRMAVREDWMHYRSGMHPP